ncbi:transposase [Actinocrinis puniceicyclus]|uniref:Transposase n=1 Tax=Actinocrinis puniceicyclus TaxID=977794 RepID=A0A8J7WQH5_9ACTN|nr:transposase [Actinocrinis puniceicyclus]MBS2966628.1 transposase [Actinocrinis puniceicyclus]
MRTSSRKTKDGTVRYLQLAHSEWDADAGISRLKILFSFGREDQLDRAAIERLIGALSRLLDPAAALTAAGPADLEVTDDPAPVVKKTGFRSHGKSKDGRDDLPQVVVGMAVTRDGIPVRVWSWPGGSADSKLIRQVKDDMRAWSLSRIVQVADRGFSSRDNRQELMRGAGGYIIGEKLRSGSGEVKAALARPGRYRVIRDNLQVKEVNIGSDDRFVLCYNPEQAERDAAVRDRLLTQLAEAIDGTDKLTRTERARLEGVLSTKPGLKRFLRVTPGGLLRIDKKKIAEEENLDGKYLLRSSDPELNSEDIALGYKQLLEVERGWRDMKQVLDLRPIYHRREDRIRAHVWLCWLALLLMRVAENTSGQTWNRIRAEAQRIHAVTFTGPGGQFCKTTQLSKTQRDLFVALGVDPPKTILDITPTTR